MLAHKVVEQPLVQIVVDTGQVSTESLAEIGSEITGLVLGKKTQAGDILALLRVDSLEADLTEAKAKLEELKNTTRVQAFGTLKEVEIGLS